MPAVLTIAHPDITTLPQTFVSNAAIPGDTTLYVQNASDFGVLQYVVVAPYGNPTAQILAINGANPSLNQIQVTPQFGYAVDTSVTQIPFNTIRVYRSLTGLGGTYTLLTQIAIQVDQDFTSYTDFGAVSPYSYRYTFYNAQLNVESDYSSEVPYNGFPFYSLNSIQQRVLGLYVDQNAEFIALSSIANWTNELLGKFNREVTDSESAPFATFTTFTPGTSESTDLSSYNIESIFLVEYSTNGGLGWNADTINPMDSRIKANNPTSAYSYKFFGNEFFVYSTSTAAGSQVYSFPSTYLVRIWYFTQQPQLSLESDTLPTLYRSFTDIFVDYCMMRANEQSRRIQESAVYYERKWMPNFEVAAESIRGRINQGNKSMALTWISEIPNW